VCGKEDEYDELRITKVTFEKGDGLMRLEVKEMLYSKERVNNGSQ